jgi:hypothetical protein
MLDNAVRYESTSVKVIRVRMVLRVSRFLTEWAFSAIVPSDTLERCVKRSSPIAELLHVLMAVLALKKHLVDINAIVCLVIRVLIVVSRLTSKIL